MRNPPELSRIHIPVTIALRDQESEIVWDTVKTLKWTPTSTVPFGKLICWTHELELEAQNYLLMERGLN